MRRDRLYLEDILEACRKIEQFIAGETWESFLANEMLFDAVVRNLQVIGEAVRTLPEETRALSPGVEWERIVGLRHLLVHHYFGVDAEIIWDLATNRVPKLAGDVREVLERLDD